MSNFPTLNSMLPDFFDDFPFASSNSFNVDVKESKNAYTVIADMPGLSKEEAKVEYDNNTLTISANHEAHKEEKNEDETYLRKERRQVSYRRSFHLPNVDENAIKASFKDGVLTIELPKGKEKETRKLIDIN